MLLALDLGMHTGWALFTRAGARLASGVWHLGKDQVRGRFGELLLYLRTKVGAQGVKRVAYEHVHHHTGIDAGHVYGGWLAVLDPITTSEIHAIAGVKRARSPKREGLSQADLRKAAKVRRDTNKMSTVEAARVRGWAVADNNEAEACFCGIAALAKGTGAP